jgi:hypothetical protein
VRNSPAVIRFVLLLAIASLALPSAAVPATIVLRATLTGKYLHTTSKGTGTATITFKGDTVCWKFSYRSLDKPNDSGIHVVPPPAAGQHKRGVIPLTATTSMSPGCVALSHWGPQAVAFGPKVIATPPAST